MSSLKWTVSGAALLSTLVLTAGCSSNENLKSKTESHRPAEEKGAAEIVDANKQDGTTIASGSVPLGTTLSGTDASDTPTGQDVNHQPEMPPTRTTKQETTGNRTGSAVGSGSDGVGGQITHSTVREVQGDEIPLFPQAIKVCVMGPSENE